MERQFARSQSLPMTEAEYLRQIAYSGEFYTRIRQLYRMGWTLRSIGEVFSPPTPRSTVRTWMSEDYALGTPTDSTDPALPSPAKAEPILKKAASPGIPWSDLTEIDRLAPIARKFRAKINPHAPAALANSELTAIVTRLHNSGHGVPVQELADAAGVTYRAMARRLGK